RIPPVIRFGLNYSIAASIVLSGAVWLLLRFGIAHGEKLQPIGALSGWVVIGVPVLAVQLVLFQTILGLQSVKLRIVLEKILQPLLRFALPFGLVLWAGDRLHAAVGGMVIGAAVLALIAAHFVTKRLRLMPASTSATGDVRQEWMRYSLPFVLYSLQNFVSVGMGLDVFLVAFLASVRESGIYAAAFRFTPVLVLARGAIDYAFGPKAGLLYGQSDLNAIRTLYKTSSTLALAWTLPFAIVLTMFSQPLMSTFFGPGYDAGAAALAILVFGFVVDGATGCNTTLLSMVGRSGLVLMNGLAGGVATVCLCLLLVPSLGITGAAVAVTVARSLVNVMATTEIWRLQHMHPFSGATAKIMAAAISAALLGLLCWWQLGFDDASIALSLPIALVAASYFALLRMTRVSWRMA
ncbi:MAG: polysaccharide biosynthesis C-terminal domain-containing protein, partial [Terriglobales bacterium]